MSERPILTELPNQELLKLAKTLDTKGWIQQTHDYCYLNINDQYIHLLYPLLREYDMRIKKPDYFSPSNSIGAHISVIYPEEQSTLFVENVGQIHSFQVSKLVKTQYEFVEYYVLSVTSPSLTTLRQMHHLSPKPLFKGYEIMFHITLGVRRARI